MTSLEVPFIWGSRSRHGTAWGKVRGPEQFAAFLPSSEGSEPQRGIGNKAVIWKASFPIQNLHLQIIRMTVWERAPEASGGCLRCPVSLGRQLSELFANMKAGCRRWEGLWEKTCGESRVWGWKHTGLEGLPRFGSWLYTKCENQG